MDAEQRKGAAVAFLQAAAAGGARKAAERLFTKGAVHHNPYFPAGMDALTDAMEENARENPGKTLTVQHVLADGDLVAVHSRVVHGAGDRGAGVVHIFRFEGDKVAELWDLGQMVPEEMANEDGMF